MQTVLLTIAGPEHAIDLKLPAEMPVGELMPKVLELCAPRSLAARQLHPERWHLLFAATGVVLNTTRSLYESGVIDGTVLLLRDIATLVQQQQQQAQAFRPRAVQPSESTGGIGVRWHVPRA